MVVLLCLEGYVCVCVDGMLKGIKGCVWKEECVFKCLSVKECAYGGGEVI